MLGDFWLYLLSFLDNWAFWFSIVLLILELAKKTFSRGFEKWPFWTFALICVFIATFQSWREEHIKAKEGITYLEAGLDPTYFPGTFPVGKRLSLNLFWRVVGSSHPALKPHSFGKIYFVPGIPGQIAEHSATVTDEVQAEYISKFKELFAQQIAATRARETPTLYPNTGPTVISIDSDEVLSEQLWEEIQSGTKVILIILANRFKDSAGVHEAHNCRYIQSTQLENLLRSSVGFRFCGDYNTQIDVDDSKF